MGIAHWDDVEPRDLRRGPMQLDRIRSRPRRGVEGGRRRPPEARPGRPLLTRPRRARRGGDLLRPRRLRALVAEREDVRGARRRHDRPPCRRGGPHADRRARRARRPCLRRADERHRVLPHACGRSSHGRDGEGRRGSSPVGPRGRCGRARAAGAEPASLEHRQPSPTSRASTGGRLRSREPPQARSGPGSTWVVVAGRRGGRACRIAIREDEEIFVVLDGSGDARSSCPTPQMRAAAGRP